MKESFTFSQTALQLRDSNCPSLSRLKWSNNDFGGISLPDVALVISMQWGILLATITHFCIKLLTSSKLVILPMVKRSRYQIYPAFRSAINMSEKDTYCKTREYRCFQCICEHRFRSCPQRRLWRGWDVRLLSLYSHTMAGCVLQKLCKGDWGREDRTRGQSGSGSWVLLFGMIFCFQERAEDQLQKVECSICIA